MEDTTAHIYHCAHCCEVGSEEGELCIICQEEVHIWCAKNTPSGYVCLGHEEALSNVDEEDTMCY